MDLQGIANAIAAEQPDVVALHPDGKVVAKQVSFAAGRSSSATAVARASTTSSR